MKIFETAKRSKSVKHYVWNSLDNVMKAVNFDESGSLSQFLSEKTLTKFPEYSAKHYDGKSRVAEYIRRYESDTKESGLTWSILSTGPYMDTLNAIFSPINVRKDGTSVFAIPIGEGHLPMIALRDLGFWARYIFDHRAETSAQELKIASDMVSLDYLVKTFTEVTGKPAVCVPQTIDEWWNNFIPKYYERPAATIYQSEDEDTSKDAKGHTTYRENFTAWWNLYRDDIIVRDMDWIRSVHPGTLSLADWMKEYKYDGAQDAKAKAVLKKVEDGDHLFFRPKPEVVSAL